MSWTKEIIGRSAVARRAVDIAVVRASQSIDWHRRRQAVHNEGTSTRGPVSVVVPAAFGSFGDEALAFGADALLARDGRRMLGVVAGDPAPWHRSGLPDVMSEDDFVGPWRLGMDQGAVEALVPGGEVWVLGADYADGVYGLRSLATRVSLLNMAARSGLRAALINFSFREEPRAGAVSLLQGLDRRVFISLRDDVSAEHFRAATGMTASSYPDLAMFLRPRATEQSERLAQWRRGHGRPTMAVVGNAHLATHFGGSIPELAEAFAAFCREAISRGWAISLVSHDVRDEPGDNLLLEAIRTHLHEADDSVRLTIPSTAASAKAALGQSDLCVTARMHPAVATLSQGVPTFGLEYVGKFTGQFAWYGAEQHLAPWTEIVERPVELARRVVSQDWDRERRRLSGRAEALRSSDPTWLRTA